MGLSTAQALLEHMEVSPGRGVTVGTTRVSRQQLQQDASSRDVLVGLVYRTLHARAAHLDALWDPEPEHCHRIASLHPRHVRETGWELVPGTERGSDVLVRHPTRSIVLVVPRDSFDGLGLAAPAARWNWRPGFVGLLSQQPDPLGPSRRRYYANVTHEGVAWFVQHVLGGLDAACVPYACKVVNNPRQLGRSDAAVLVVDERHRACVDALVVAPPVEATHPHVSLFCAPHAPGIASAVDVVLADDPTMSFGLHRSHAVAAGIARSVLSGLDPAAAIADAARSAGIDPDTFSEPVAPRSNTEEGT